MVADCAKSGKFRNFALMEVYATVCPWYFYVYNYLFKPLMLIDFPILSGFMCPGRHVFYLLYERYCINGYANYYVALLAKDFRIQFA